MRGLIVTMLAVSLCAANARGGERVLKFPPERALGIIHIRDAQPPAPSVWSNWVRVGLAQGDVAIPDGKEVRFDPSHDGIKDLSPLTSLKPDDIAAMYSSSSDGGVDTRSLAHLTGLRTLLMHATKLTDDELAAIGGMTELESLHLGASPIADSQLEHLVPLKKLRVLILRGTKVTDAGLATVAKMQSLEEIDLGDCDVGDPGMKHLAALKGLRKLAVEHTDVGDAGIAAIATLPALEQLNIQETPVTDAGLASLAKTKLKELYLRPRGTIGDAGMEHVGKITTLERATLPSSVTDAGARHLVNLKALKYIYLPGDLTDAGVADIAKLTALENVALGGDAITDAGFSQLAALPKLNEIRGGGIGPITLQKLAERGASIEALSFSGEKISPEHLKLLPRFPNLKRIYPNDIDLRGKSIDGIVAARTIEFIQMFDVKIDDDALARLATMPALKHLLLPHDAPEVTNAGVKSLAKIKTLEQLDVFGKDFNDETLAALGTMPNLATLQVYGDFTDAGLAHLEGMPALEGLFTSGKNLSPRALDRLQQRTPSLQRLEAQTPKPRPKVALKVGADAPNFAIKTFDGKPIAKKDLAGKVVLLHFWATWCAPCVASTGYVKEMHDELSKDANFAMISVSLDDEEHPPRRHAERYGLKWPQTSVGLGGKIADDYGIEGVATLVVIGPDGKIVAEGSYDAARDATVKALKQMAK